MIKCLPPSHWTTYIHTLIILIILSLLPALTYFLTYKLDSHFSSSKDPFYQPFPIPGLWVILNMPYHRRKGVYHPNCWPTTLGFLRCFTRMPHVLTEGISLEQCRNGESVGLMRCMSHWGHSDHVVQSHAGVDIREWMSCSPLEARPAIFL